MMIAEIEQETMDMDWFFTDGKHIGFMASGGGKLPDSVAESESNRQLLALYFRNLPDTSEVLINPELDTVLINSQRSNTGADERYLEDYVLMTKKGLYAFDKTKMNNFLDPYYHLVASPKAPLELKDLPQHIIDILIRTQYTHKLVDAMEVKTIGIN
nr:hypothetical protein [uncultured Chryseobacterium sp.]